jgi:hypothetical protein|tara:strand:+ start:19835 stop:20527 length:693 start_codon:yes stop_codon:yes gene_type:complete
MTNGTLDDATKQALDDLPGELVTRFTSYAYFHEILLRGIDAVAHVHLMRSAQDVLDEKISLNELRRKYRLDFGLKGTEGGQTMIDGFIGHLSTVEGDGLFVPRHAYSDERGQQIKRRMIRFFSRRNYEKIDDDTWTDKDYALQLVERRWRPGDLRNQELVAQGLRFGRDLWNASVAAFEESQERGAVLDYRHGQVQYGPPQSQEVTELGRKLIAHYSSVVNSDNHIETLH